MRKDCLLEVDSPEKGASNGPIQAHQSSLSNFVAWDTPTTCRVLPSLLAIVKQCCID